MLAILRLCFEIAPRRTAPGGDKVAWFKDPDGNVLSLSEHVS